MGARPTALPAGATVTHVSQPPLDLAEARRFAALAITVPLLAVLVSLAPSAGRPSALAGPTPSELVGQRLVVAFRGTAPSAALLARVRRGDVAGVILFGGNVTSASQLRSLSARLQAAARAGGRPPLLVAVDQEGGEIRRLPWVGPVESAAGLGRSSPSSVRRMAREAGRSLRAVGVNVDLAPVADVPVSGSFMAAEGRTFSATPASVGVLATAFAAGLADAGVAAAVKHFPGIGRALRSTDRSAVTLTAPRSALDLDLAPFRRAIMAGVPIVMLSNASYSAFGPAPAAWSTRIQALLRRDLGFRGVTITDALDAAAATRGRTVSRVAGLALRAGVDLVLLTGSEESSDAVFRALLGQVSDGEVPAASLRRSYDRVLALKRDFG